MIGELNPVATQALGLRLDRLRDDKKPVRLDLSEVEFVDSSGLMVLTRAVSESRKTGWQFEIERDVSPAVKSRLEVSGLLGIVERLRDQADS